MKKTVLFVILDKYADWEAAYLSSLLLNLGQDQFSIKTVSLTRGTIESMGGFTVLPNYDIQSVPADYEALVLIGGMSWRNEEARQVEPLVWDALHNEKVLGGICDGTVFLGAMGVLNNVKHTSNDVNDLKEWAKDTYTGEDKYIMEPAVRDCNIITANGTAPLEFAREMLIALDAAPEDRILQWYEFHKKGFYEVPMPAM